MNNLNEIFESQKNKLKDKSLFWHKENGNWVSISWSEADRQINVLSEFLKKIGIDKGDRVSLISKNSPFWCISDLAIMKIGAITVPAYTTSNENELLYLKGSIPGSKNSEVLVKSSVKNIVKLTIDEKIKVAEQAKKTPDKKKK